jgi:D-amino peptidase
MKIYVSVDLEGISGIVRNTQLYQGEPHYEEARLLLTDEVNASWKACCKQGRTK